MEKTDGVELKGIVYPDMNSVIHALSLLFSVDEHKIRFFC